MSLLDALCIFELKENISFTFFDLYHHKLSYARLYNVLMSGLACHILFPPCLAIFSGWPLTDHIIHLCLIYYSLLAVLLALLWPLQMKSLYFLKMLGNIHPVTQWYILESWILIYLSVEHYKQWHCETLQLCLETECIQNILDEILQRWRTKSSTQCCMFWSATDMALDILCFQIDYFLYRM